MANLLLLAEHDGKTLSPATAKALTAALQMGEAADILIAGQNCEAAAQEAAKLKGARRILLADSAALSHQLAEPLAALIARLAKDYSHICAAATTIGKNVLPRAAALLDVAQLSDIVEVRESDVFVHPTYAGNVMETVRMKDEKKLLTIRATAFAAAPAAEKGEEAPIETIEAGEASELSSYVGEELTQSDRPELTAARIVISGGRGMQSGENFHLLETIADKLGAAVGASRAAVDSGFVPNDYQVGQTGKTVAPELYIAVGISGAIQHLAGMKDSKTIVAINKDEEAPIFQIADYGLVADLFDALPELAQELDKLEN